MASEWNNGMPEYWNIGVRAEINHINYEKHPSFNFVQDKLTHHSIIPIGTRPLGLLLYVPQHLQWGSASVLLLSCRAE